MNSSPLISSLSGDEFLPAEASSVSLLASRLHFFLQRKSGAHNPPVFLCIGTDRMIGDSLGPCTGTLLSRQCPSLPVYGSLQSPVHAGNLSEILLKLKKEHPTSPVIAVDASLGLPCHIGHIAVRGHGLTPGLGVSKTLGRAGDISIIGVSSPQGTSPWPSLMTARLSTVMAMADCISKIILEACS